MFPELKTKNPRNDNISSDICESCCPITSQVTTVQPDQLVGTGSELTGASQVEHLQPVNISASTG